MNNTFVSKNKSKSRWGNLPETSDVEEKGNRFISKDKREKRTSENEKGQKEEERREEKEQRRRTQKEKTKTP